MRLRSNDLALYAVTDRSWLNGRNLKECVEQAIEGGVTLVQLREKNTDVENFIKIAQEVKEVCERYSVPLIINDNLEVAKAVDADGIHVGQSDRTLEEVIANWDENKIYGVSAQTVEQAQTAQRHGATYLGVGAIFATATKNDAEMVSIHDLKEIVRAVDIPVCAIGGIDKENIEKLYDTGIDGVALVSEIFNKSNIKFNTKELVQLVKPFRKDV